MTEQAEFSKPAEEFYAGPIEPLPCDPTVKPGTLKFKNFVIQNFGGGDSGILRSCSVGKPSDHWSGCAWDWKLNASKQEDLDRANRLFELLFTNNFELFRRAGLKYIIWNNQIMGCRNTEWKPYTGQSPHNDHVHFSLSPDGANGRTSFYSSLIIPDPESGKYKQSNLKYLLTGSVVGFLGVKIGGPIYDYLTRRTRSHTKRSKRAWL